MKIGIVTDNTCNLKPGDIEKLGVNIVSLYVNRSGKYTRAIDLDLDSYYNELGSVAELPTTSQPSPQDFMEAFGRALQNFDVLVVPLISGKLSGTFVSASIASRDFDMPIHVIDTLLTENGLGMLVKNLSKMIANGSDTDALVKYATDFHKKIRTIFSVDDLNYLYKGGRIGKAKALMGNLLKMKPVLQLEDGELKPVENIRGNKKLLQSMVDHTLKGKDPADLKKVEIVYIKRNEDAEELKRILLERVPNIEVEISLIEPVIGTHLGPEGI
ncbi:MAG TPA: DegV family protein, partial [Mesotoga infera]|nr:DegV family protein [Mesotoga infera]